MPPKRGGDKKKRLSESKSPESERSLRSNTQGKEPSVVNTETGTKENPDSPSAHAITGTSEENNPPPAHTATGTAKDIDAPAVDTVMGTGTSDNTPATGNADSTDDTLAEGDIESVSALTTNEGKSPAPTPAPGQKESAQEGSTPNTTAQALMKEW